MALTQDIPTAASSWIVEPFVQRSGKGLYNPINGALSDDAELNWLYERKDAITEPPTHLVDQGWIVRSKAATASRYHLRFASIETFSLCNQSCNFCPVSVESRPKMLMEQSRFERLVADLTAYRDSLEGVFLNFYNEPTLDPHFMDRVRALKEAKLKMALLTNASGLTEPIQDQLRELGGVDFLSINLNTLDRDRYRKSRGKDHLTRVLARVDSVAARPISDNQVINVLGDGGVMHQSDTQTIEQRYADGSFTVSAFVANTRCGQCGPSETITAPLAGCEQMGSRLFNHIHILANGTCVLCCQDYFERHRVGNVFEQTVHEVMSGPTLVDLRLQAHGLRAPQPNLLCQRCDFALHEDSLPAGTP